MAGLFFCLASDTVQGFYFAQTQYSHTQAFTAAFCCPCNYTDTTSKAFAGLYRGFSVDLTYSSAHNTADTQAAYIPPPPRRMLYRLTQLPYYNKVYKGASLLWIHARRCSTSQTMQARRLSRYLPRPAACDLAPGQPGILHPAGQSSSRGAEPLAATAAALFGLSPDSQ